jgi:anaphase-promoting complex subunit 1
MFTFGTIPALTRESFVVPKIEFQIRLHPQNLVIGPEVNKIPKESLDWGEFHNGVAAGLRIAPVTHAVESSWIAFNKPSELTPEHAGFLFALGLTGHLKEMLTWQTFNYLTPKHELTSIGILLGLSAANTGTGHEHVTKLLAVHAPALLPDPEVDLNVPLVTQTAALTGLGLLYMGTRKRHMAEVLLSEMKKRDNAQPDLTNEHREAYTLAAGFGFGMVMLGKGADVPADRELVHRLRALIHGPSGVAKPGGNVPAFDVNLTSPAATIALGLMYLRTERKDIADVIAIPDAVVELHRIQPSFLLMRTVARALIMWDAITPTNDWLMMQIPVLLRQAIESRNQGKTIDDALELAYFNIVAGACFAVALKYAGTAEEGAYLMIVAYYDLYSRLAYTNGKLALIALPTPLMNIHVPQGPRLTHGSSDPVSGSV